MRFDLVIFDLDGTLVDSSPDICAAINHVISPYGCAPFSLEKTRELVGEGAMRLMEKVIETNVLEVEPVRLLQGFLAYYGEHLLDMTTIYPGVIEALQSLTGIRKAVVTNKHDHLSVRTLQEMELLQYFDMVVGSETAPAKKPSPLPILYVLERFRVAPDRAVIVGDSTYDVEAGKNAGITTIAVTYGYRPAEVLRGADLQIDSMNRLPEALARLSRVGS